MKGAAVVCMITTNCWTYKSNMWFWLPMRSVGGNWNIYLTAFLSNKARTVKTVNIFLWNWITFEKKWSTARQIFLKSFRLTLNNIHKKSKSWNAFCCTFCSLHLYHNFFRILRWNLLLSSCRLLFQLGAITGRSVGLQWNGRRVAEGSEELFSFLCQLLQMLDNDIVRNALVPYCSSSFEPHWYCQTRTGATLKKLSDILAWLWSKTIVGSGLPVWYTHINKIIHALKICVAITWK